MRPPKINWLGLKNLSIILGQGFTHPATHGLRNGMAPPPPLWCSIATAGVAPPHLRCDAET